MIGQNQIELKMVWELMEEPEFPCMFVPLNYFDGNLHYVFEKAVLTECKIRGGGHYFKIALLKPTV